MTLGEALELSVSARNQDARIYVAAAKSDAPRARRVMSRLRVIVGPDAIVHDWTEDLGPSQGDEGLDDDDALGRAVLCLDGVLSADLVWLLASESCRGSFFELGEAHARGRRLVVSGPRNRISIFTQFAELHDTDDSALRAVARWAATHGRWAEEMSR